MDRARIAGFVELDLGAFAHNAAVLRAPLAAGTAFGGVVKGDAYGHGLAACLPAIHGAVDWLFVVTAQDALAIRAWEARAGASRRPVLVLGVLDPDEVVACARAGVDVVVADPGFDVHARAVRDAGCTLAVHVHLDTGLSREGFLPDGLDGALRWLDDGGAAIDVRGAMMHFADVEDVTDPAWAREQLRRFDDGVARLRDALRARGRPVDVLVHAAASAAGLVLPSSRLGLVRSGIALYGLWPSRETRIGARVVLGEVPALRPVLSWRVPVQTVKTVPAGAPVGYGCTWTAPRPSRLAVLPVGYFDGYPRALGNRAHVLLRGARCPVVGRVMMNHVVIDTTDAPGAAVGDVATLIGADGAARVTADELADAAGTIHYEITTRIAAHVPRIPLVQPGSPGAG